MNKVPLTKKGAENLQAELHQLKTIDRPRITQAIAEARAHGPGFFRQGNVVLFPLFLGFFLFCFVLERFDGADGDAL